MVVMLYSCCLLKLGDRKNRMIQLLAAVEFELLGRVLKSRGSTPSHLSRHLLGFLPARSRFEGGRLLFTSAVFCLLRGVRLFINAAIVMRLLASTAVPTHNSNHSRPLARKHFTPRPRNSTEMRPSIPARKRCPRLKAELFS